LVLSAGNDWTAKLWDLRATSWKSEFTGLLGSTTYSGATGAVLVSFETPIPATAPVDNVAGGLLADVQARPRGSNDVAADDRIAEQPNEVTAGGKKRKRADAAPREKIAEPLATMEHPRVVNAACFRYVT
jgi:hypothetical protein